MTIDTRKRSARGAHSTPPRARPIFILAVVLVAALAINVETTIVNVALPTLNSALGASTRGLQWIVDAYNLAFAALVLAGGTVGDKFGRRGTLIAGLAIVRGQQRRRGTVHLDRVADRHASGDGRRVCADLPDHAGDHHRHLPRSQAAGGGDRRVGRGHRASGWPSARSWGARCWSRSGGAACSWPWRRSRSSRRSARCSFVPASTPEPAPDWTAADCWLSVVMLGALVYTIIEAPEHGWTATRTLVGFGVALAAALMLRMVGATPATIR